MFGWRSPSPREEHNSLVLQAIGGAVGWAILLVLLAVTGEWTIFLIFACMTVFGALLVYGLTRRRKTWKEARRERRGARQG